MKNVDSGYQISLNISRLDDIVLDIESDIERNHNRLNDLKSELFELKERLKHYDENRESKTNQNSCWKMA